jgi:hypothetical protein
MSHNLFKRNFSTSEKKESSTTINNDSSLSFLSLKQPTE